MNEPRDPLAVRHLRTFIGSNDFELSSAFYEGMGFELEEVAEGLKLATRGTLSFYLQDYYQKDWCENSMVFMSVTDAGAWRRQIDRVLQDSKFSSVRVKGPEDEGYALVTFLWDPAGVLWHIAQPK